jgi:GT2 family glycosyltransferase
LAHRLFLDRFYPALVPRHFLSDWDHRDTRSVDQVIGAFLLIRRGLFEKLQGFDERYFLYYEDVDLCLSVRKAGWKVVYFAGARAEHVGGGSTGGAKGRRLYYLTISRTQYTAKWHGKMAAVAVFGLSVILELPIRWLHAIVARPPQERRAVLEAMKLVFKDVGNLTWRRGGVRRE